MRDQGLEDGRSEGQTQCEGIQGHGSDALDEEGTSLTEGHEALKN